MEGFDGDLKPTRSSEERTRAFKKPPLMCLRAFSRFTLSPLTCNVTRVLFCLVVFALAGCSLEKSGGTESFAEFPVDFRGSYSGVAITKEGPEENSRHTVQLTVDESFQVSSLLWKDGLSGSIRKWNRGEGVVLEDGFEATDQHGRTRFERRGKDLRFVREEAYIHAPIQGFEIELQYDEEVEEPQDLGMFHWDKEQKKAVAQIEMIIPKQGFELTEKSIPISLDSNPDFELYLDKNGEIKSYDKRNEQMIRFGEEEEQSFIARLDAPSSSLVVLSGKNASLVSGGSSSKVMADDLAVAVQGTHWRATVEIYEDGKAVLLSEQGRVRFGADGRPVQEAKGSSGVFFLTARGDREVR